MNRILPDKHWFMVLAREARRVNPNWDTCCWDEAAEINAEAERRMGKWFADLVEAQRRRPV